MSQFLPKRIDLILLIIAILLNMWSWLLIPLHSYGTVSFASGYRKVHIGMSWQEWQGLLQQHGVQNVCDANSFYVYDVLRTYHVVFRKIEGEPSRIYSKASYVHFRLPGYYW